jgi:hypothetical protein
MARTTTSILPTRVLEYWYGPQEDWGLNGMVDETWLDNPTDSRLDIYNLEKYVHEEVDKDYYLENLGIYMVVKKPSRSSPTGFYGFPYRNSDYAELKTQGNNRIEVTTYGGKGLIFTPYEKPFAEDTNNKNDQTHFSMIEKDERSRYVDGAIAEYAYYKLSSYSHTTFESVSRILNWYPFPEIFIE